MIKYFKHNVHCIKFDQVVCLLACLLSHHQECAPLVLVTSLSPAETLRFLDVNQYICQLVGLSVSQSISQPSISKQTISQSMKNVLKMIIESLFKEHL